MKHAQVAISTTLFFVSLFGTVSVMAAGPQTLANQDIAAIKAALASRYPNVAVTEVRPSPVPGLYQVMSADAVVYTDRSGDYLIAGPMIATQSKKDLSQQALDERDQIRIDQLPLDLAIKTVRGSGERTVVVFADPDCPYCHELEKELAGLNDITIYTFLYPLTNVHPDAHSKAHAIWCAQDRSAAWHNWMILDKPPTPSGTECSQDPLDATQKLGISLKISTTPVVFLENGHRVRGSRTAAQLNSLIDDAQVTVSQPVARGSAPEVVEHKKS